jgi:hypothetical protein
MTQPRLAAALAVSVVLLAGALSLVQPARAGHDPGCPARPLPPSLEGVCRACPTFVDPVVCTVVCPGGPQEVTFSNQCFASCSGHIILGECRRTGG